MFCQLYNVTNTIEQPRLAFLDEFATRSEIRGDDCAGVCQVRRFQNRFSESFISSRRELLQ